MSRRVVCKNNFFLSFREFDESDEPSEFFCDAFITDMRKLPLKGEVKNKPWPGYYWPIKHGGISVRYGLYNKSTIGEYDQRRGQFNKFYTYNESIAVYSQPHDHIQNNNTDFLNYVDMYYSPAEKYDLLVGDLDYTLTNRMKIEGKYMQKDKKGDVPGWMGYCHGWTPASFMEREPTKSVHIKAADNVTYITFLPDDIKGLASVYYIDHQHGTKFIGNRCKYNISEVPKDEITGLWEDYSCFGINPASFVITFGNQIGIRKENLIFDPDSRGEIWNQPAVSYTMSYYNIVSKVSGGLETSTVDVNELRKQTDKILNYLFKKKTTKTTKIVGVEFGVKYLGENLPVHSDLREVDINDYLYYSGYKFALELDDDYNAVGGEWLTNNHPIFIWKIEDDNDKEEFHGTVEELIMMRDEARTLSKNQKLIKRLIKYLVRKSTTLINS